MAKTASEMVEDMKTFFATPGQWCQGACARDANGKPVSSLSPNAVQFDMYGFLIKTNFQNNFPKFDQLLAAQRIIQGMLPPGTKSKDIEKWNDGLADEAALLDFLN